MLYRAALLLAVLMLISLPLATIAGRDGALSHALTAEQAPAAERTLRRR